MNRSIEPYILKDLQKKMVFVGGPRQCGKTTLAKQILKKIEGLYFNWDLNRDRESILKMEWERRKKLIIFDEIHKYGKWKNLLKGFYDTLKEEHQFLITGSARLDVYRRGGDSLLGRYHYWRLHPFTLSEIPPGIDVKDAFQRLMSIGGFPEPFLDANEREARRWRQERIQKVLKDDVRDLENLKNIQSLELLVDLLRTRVGSPVVMSNLAEDLQVASATIKNWLQVLERMYLIFSVSPLTQNIARAIQKPQKVYFYDNSDVEISKDLGARFENLVATHLLKAIHFSEDYEGYRYQLNYIRDKEGREVDFAIVKDKKVHAIVEVKYSDSELSSSLKYYAEKLKPKHCVQIVGELRRPYSSGCIEVVSAVDFLTHPEQLLR